MKKWMIIVAVAVIAAVAIGFKMNIDKYDGSTFESRQLLMEDAREGFSITSETVVDEYIVANIHSGNEWGYAVFAPEGNEKYSLRTTLIRDISANIIIGQLYTGDKDYDIVICNEPDLDYAVLTYLAETGEQRVETIPAECEKPIMSENNYKNYTLNAVFHDKSGNIIE